MHSWIIQRDHFKSEPGARSGEAAAPALGWLLNLEHIFCRAEFLWKHKLFTAQHRQDERILCFMKLGFIFPYCGCNENTRHNSHKGQTPGFPEELEGHMMTGLWKSVNGYIFYY